MKGKTEVELDRDFLSCVLITASEGGINYWADVLKVEDEGEDRMAIFLAVRANEDEEPLFKVDHETVVRGIQRLLDGSVRVDSQIRGYLSRAVAERDAGDVDADVADCIVQAGIFNELVYG